MDINLNVVIKAPELVDSINHLALALASKPLLATATVESAATTEEAAATEQPKTTRSRRSSKKDQEPEKNADPVPTENSQPEPEPEVQKAETAETAEEPKAEPAEKQATLVDVRGKLTELSKAGKKAEVKKLIESFGAVKLTDIPEDKYGELLAKAVEIE